jgi:hypothetical protein
VKGRIVLAYQGTKRTEKRGIWKLALTLLDGLTAEDPAGSQAPLELCYEPSLADA